MRKTSIVVMLAMLAILSPAFAAITPYRTVTAVDSVAKTFSCEATPEDPSWTYKVTPKTVIKTVGERIWHRDSFSAIKVGASVSVRYHMDGNNRIAERVVIRPKH